MVLFFCEKLLLPEAYIDYFLLLPSAEQLRQSITTDWFTISYTIY